MPIYEFECLKCKKIFEKLVFKNDEKITCPYCGSENVQKIMSSVYSRDRKKDLAKLVKSLREKGQKS